MFSYFWFSFSQHYDAQGSNASFFKVQQQLTKTENQLEELEQKYKIIFEAVGDAIFVADIETGLIVDCNLEATKLVHRDRTDIIGKHQSSSASQSKKVTAIFLGLFRNMLMEMQSSLKRKL